jgi:hypothetical protein
MKGDPSKQRDKLLYTLAGERILRRREETYSNAAMIRGTEMEPEACAVFEMMTEQEVQHVGFCFQDERVDRGCSPDGLIGEMSGLEIKCPSLPVHIEYLLGGKLPAAYFQQVHGSMLMTDRDTWWFCSYYPDMPPLILKVDRDEKFTTALDAALDVFCAELSELTAKLKAMQK